MVTKEDLMDWVVDALTELGGAGTILQISKIVWRNHEDDLRASGDLFFTWQYDLRWAGHKLRHAGQLAAVDGRRNLPWTLA